MNRIKHMERLEACADTLLGSGSAKNLIVRVGKWDRVLYDLFRSAEERTLSENTLFDMASVTKIVVTTTLALIAIDRGLLSDSDPVSKFFPVPEDKRELTVRHLLTHTMGYGHKSLLPHTDGYGSVERYVLSIPIDVPIGSDVRYSCPGFILLGRILEAVYGMRLDEAFVTLVADPLGLDSSRFLPEKGLDFVNSCRSPERLGTVNDYNCYHLGGVAGNAGLFSSLSDLSRYVGWMLAKGAPIVSEETFGRATRNYTAGMSASRGLGFLYVDDRYKQTGGLFPEGSIGHCGHTGQSVFVDPKSGLYVIILSDATVSTVKKYGKEHYEEVMEMRRALHAAIREDLSGSEA